MQERDRELNKGHLTDAAAVLLRSSVSGKSDRGIQLSNLSARIRKPVLAGLHQVHSHVCRA
jgi:hypothetical protein